MSGYDGIKKSRSVGYVIVNHCLTKTTAMKADRITKDEAIIVHRWVTMKSDKGIPFYCSQISFSVLLNSLANSNFGGSRSGRISSSLNLTTVSSRSITISDNCTNWLI